MKRNLPRATDQKLAAFIQTFLLKRKEKEESLSFLIRTVRDEGMHMPTNINFAEDEFTRLGFTLRKEYNQYGSVLRTYVQCKAG